MYDVFSTKNERVLLITGSFSWWSSESEQGLYDDEASDVSGRCLPCHEGCSFCRDNAPCLAQEDSVLRVAVASFHGLCMLLDFISMPVVYHFRRNKVSTCRDYYYTVSYIHIYL